MLEPDPRMLDLILSNARSQVFEIRTVVLQLGFDLILSVF